ncbi:hypothetical protein NicSoilB11_14770 [Arthrobacter sp. NicSoilB11]|nr:hypothetical protein NicSoilB11_14770 [Arthrobacter sp. NicSoilB11]
MAGNLGIDGVFAQRAQEKLGQSYDHGWYPFLGKCWVSRAGQFVWVLIYRHSTSGTDCGPRTQ